MGILDGVQSAAYIVVATFLIVMLILTLYVVVVDLYGFFLVTPNVHTLHGALNDLMFTLIVAELLQTVFIFVKYQRIDLKLLLVAGLTALIRHVLVFGVEQVAWQDMLVEGILILILVVSILLIGNKSMIMKSDNIASNGPEYAPRR